MSESSTARWPYNHLDYKSEWKTEWTPDGYGFVKEKYVPHNFPPLSKGTKLIGESDLNDRGDGFEISKKGDYLYYSHMFSSGLSVVDVKDPTNPEVVKFIPTDSPHLWSIKNRACGNLLVVAQEWNFWEPLKYHLEGFRGPKEPIETGIKIYDISDPADPKFQSFFKTGGWSRHGGGVGCHRFSFDGHYTYISPEMPGYRGRILLIVDVLSDPKDPKEISRWWLPGMWTAGGERPWWPDYADRGWGVSLHQAIGYKDRPGYKDRCYCAWFAGGGSILDISDIKIPTLITRFNFDMGGNNHTFFPIKTKHGEFAIFDSEWNAVYMLDINDEKWPRVISTFPRPSREFLKRGSFRVRANVGPAIHCIHENQPGPDSFKSDELIIATAACAGLRIFDISDPYRIKEIGYYVPGTPKKQYDPRGPLYGGVDIEHCWVDNKGLIYLSDFNHGLRIIESEFTV